MCRHVAQIAPRALDLLHEVVQSVEMDVGEELAREVADRQAPAALEGGEQVVAGGIEMYRLRRVRAVDDGIDAPQGLPALDAPAHVRFEGRVVDGRQVTVEAATQPIRRAFSQSRYTFTAVASKMAARASSSSGAAASRNASSSAP